MLSSVVCQATRVNLRRQRESGAAVTRSARILFCYFYRINEIGLWRWLLVLLASGWLVCFLVDEGLEFLTESRDLFSTLSPSFQTGA